MSEGSLNTTVLQVLSMCSAFSKAGWDVVLATESRSECSQSKLDTFIRSAFKEDSFVKTVFWERKLQKKFINRFFVRSKILAIIEREIPDLIFTREPLFLRAIVKKRIPVIFESHNSKQHNRSFLLHLFIKNEIKRISFNKYFICLLTISQNLLNFWQKQGVPENKLFAWHDGFDSELFENVLSKKKARKYLNLPLDKKIVIYTGGLYPDREIENILKLAEKNSEHLFIIIGGPEKNRIFFENLANQNKIYNVHFRGFVQHKNIPEYLYAGDILLALWSQKVPTISYCSPLKLFEYMAARRLIIVHDFPTIREVLEDGIDAIFCKPGNFQSLNSKFSEALVKIDIDDFGINARKKAFEMFTWNNRVKKIMEFLKFDE